MSTEDCDEAALPNGPEPLQPVEAVPTVEMVPRKLVEDSLSYLAAEEQRLKAEAHALDVQGRLQIREGERLQQTAKDLADEKRGIQEQQEQLQRLNQELAPRVQLQAEIEKARCVVAKHEVEVQGLRSKLERVQADLDRVRSNSKECRDLDRIRYERLDQELRRVKAEAEARLHTLQAHYEEAVAESEQTRTQIQSAIRSGFRERLEKATEGLKQKVRSLNQLLSEVQGRLDSVTRAEADLRRQLGARNRRIDQLERRLAQVDAPSEEVAAAPWCLDHLAMNRSLCRRLFGTTVVTTGSSPYPETEFDAFLKRCGIVPCRPGTNVGVMIVGRKDWDEADLETQVRTREGKTLKVYSQSMVVYALAMGSDPFLVLSHEQLLEVGGDHPALRFLRELGFDWPEGRVEHGQGPTLDAADWPEEGPLKHLGYTVGVYRGRPPRTRRRILTRAFEAKNGHVLMANGTAPARWGRSGSAARLKGIAYSISRFVDLASGRANVTSFRRAIRDWKKDLAWLRVTYYRPSMRFRWPASRV